MTNDDGELLLRRRASGRRRRLARTSHRRRKTSSILSNAAFLATSLALTALRNGGGGGGPADADASPFGLVSTAPPAPGTFACFAGFGAKKKKAGGKKKASNKKGAVRNKGRRSTGGGGGGGAVSAAVASSAATSAGLLTAEGRIAHIRSRVEVADLSPMAELSLSTNEGGQSVLDMNPNAVCVVDDFLGPDLVRSMRAEAESILGTMVPSQSTRWDEASQSVVPYDKVGVLSTQIEGGERGYAATPRLVEYVATLTGELSRRLNGMLPPPYRLSGAAQTNKLAVCLGDGSKYDKHIDNLGGGADGGGGDRRKLTALLYLQPPGSHPPSPSYPDESEVGDERGGYFRAYDVPRPGDVVSVAPRGDRLLLFWSDALVHDVSPSFAPDGADDRRWALTVWLLADEETGVIRATDAAIEERHFGSG